MIMIDVMLKFVTAQQNDVKLLVRARVIALNYLKTYFIIDFLSFFPSLVTVEEVDWVYYFKVLRFI